MDNESKLSAIGGDMVQTLQINVMFAAVKVLIQTHPDPKALLEGLQDVFAQLQSSEVFLRLSQDQRDVARQMLSSMILPLQDKAQSQWE